MQTRLSDLNFKKNPYRGIIKEVAKKMSRQKKKDVSRQSIYQFIKHNNVEVMKMVISEVNKRSREFEKLKKQEFINNN